MEGIDNVRRGMAGGRICLAILVLVLALSGFLVRPAHAQGEGGAAHLRCEPTSVTVEPGVQFFVDMYIEDVVNLQAADAIMYFDPTYVQAVDVDQFVDGVQIQPLSGFMPVGFVLFRVADNVTGEVHYANTILGPNAVTGSGSIARIFFTGVQEGTFMFEYTFTKLSDPNGVEIPSTSEGCPITIGTPTAVHLSAASAGQSSGMAVAVGVATLLLGAITGWGFWQKRSRPDAAL